MIVHSLRTQMLAAIHASEAPHEDKLSALMDRCNTNCLLDVSDDNMMEFIKMEKIKFNYRKEI